jgi:hypothetical protein
MQLAPLRNGGALSPPARPGQSVRAAEVGLCKLNPVVTHSLKAPGSNHSTYQVKNWFQAFAFYKCNLYRDTERARLRQGMGVRRAEGVHRGEATPRRDSRREARRKLHRA